MIKLLRIAALLASALAAPLLAASGPEVFYFQLVSGRCAWTIQSVGDLKKRVVYSSRTCPSEVFWRSDHAYFQTETGVYSLAKGAQKAELVINLLEGERLTGVTNDSFKTAREVLVPDGAVKKVGEKTQFSFEGEVYDASSLPDWGVPYMAIAYEHKDGKRKEVRRVPTRDEAGDTPGLHVLGDWMRFSAPSLKFLKSQYTAAAGEFDTEALKGGKVRIKLDQMTGLAVGQETGDTVHFMPPVAFCDAGCKKERKFNVSFHQLAVQAQSNYLLLAHEYSNDDAQVFRFFKAEPTLDLKRAKSAIWVIPAIKEFWP